MSRRVCYVTGTRAEFGLMRSTLSAIGDQAGLELQLVVTGMHLSRAHGRTIDQIRREGWRVDATVPWRESTSKDGLAAAVGRATAGFAEVFARLKPEIVLICGDRVEPFAAVSAAHVAGRVVAHVHGGDRALGQVDDALRHAMSKLSHLHFCATAESRRRLFQMGEDAWRLHRVGTPGVDGIRELAAANPHEPVTAVVALHPESGEEATEHRRAHLLLKTLLARTSGPIVVVYPNNDPGWRGIARAIEAHKGDKENKGDSRLRVARDLPRGAFLGLIASSAMLVGNSSSGIIEAASLGTPVVNVGDRQKGRERSGNISDAAWTTGAIGGAIERIWNRGRPVRFRGRNVYGGGGAGRRIATVLADVPINGRLLRKLIRY